MTFEELVKIAGKTANNALDKINWDDFVPMLEMSLGRDDAEVVVRIIKSHAAVTIAGSVIDAQEKLSGVPVIPTPSVEECEAILAQPLAEDVDYAERK